jgi:predicted TIM-barrel fold metal-dependent hydrolase
VTGDYDDAKGGNQVMFIDIHVHTRRIPGPPRANGQTYASPEQLLERYAKIDVDSAVLLPGVNPECAHVPQSNEEILEICQMYPGRFIPFCNIDPRAVANSADAPLDRLMLFYKERGYKGIGEVCANLPFEHPMVRNLFKHAESVGFPLTFHIAPAIGGQYGLYDDPGLPQLEKSLQDFPGLRFLGHSQAFWAEMAPLQNDRDRYGYPKYPITPGGAVPKLMERYENLYGDLSAGSGYNALARDEEYAVEFLDRFQDRLLFGTDICAPDTPTPLVDLLLRFKDEGKISATVFEKIAYKNAQLLLNL